MFHSARSPLNKFSKKSSRSTLAYRRRACFETLELRQVMAAYLKVESFTQNNSASFEHKAITGDDRSGIAVSSTTVFASGDGATGRFSAADLSGGAGVGALYDGMFSDLATGKAYVLASSATTPLSFPTGVVNFHPNGATVTHIIELNGTTGALTANAIALSTPIVLPSVNGTDAGIFAGAGRVIIHDDNGVLSEITIANGNVTSRGTISIPTHFGTENWAYWGIAEHFDGDDYLTYVQSNQAIVRTRLSDGVTTTISTFSNLGRIGAFVTSTDRQRWYYDVEGVSQLFITYADAEISYGVDFIDVTPTPRTTGINSIEVTFEATPDTNSFTASDLVLTRNGQPVTLSGLTISLVSGTTYRIDGLTAANSADGNYVLSLPFGSVTSGGVKFGGKTTWTVDAIPNAPTVVSTSPANGGNLIATSFNSLTVTFSEVVTSATAQDVRNYKLTGPNGAIAITGAALGVDGKTVTLSVATQSTQGSYSLTVGNLSDQVGNAMPALSTYNPTPVVTTIVGEKIGPYIQAFADFDRDGIKDLITVRNSDTKDLLFFKGNSNGTFAAPVVMDNVISSGTISQMKSADLNKDGKQDLVVVEHSSKVHVLFGKGDGTFDPALVLPPVQFFGPVSVEIGDINSDNLLDVVVGSQSSGGLAYLNDGTKSATTWQSVAIANGYGYNDFALVDLNADGKLDYVAASGSNGYTLLGNGSGGFTFAGSYSYPFTQTDILTVADLDGDGLQDLVVGGNSTQIMYGITRPVGQPSAPFFSNSATLLGSNIGQDARHVEAVDLDGDGDLDLIKGSSNGNGGTGGVFISWNKGNRVFENQTISLSAFGFDSNAGTYTLSFTDINSDGLPEIIVAPYLGDKIFTLYSQAKAVSSTFTLQTNFPPTTPIEANGKDNQVNEGAAAGTQVGVTASSTDPEGGAVTYSLTSNPNNYFAIDPSSGAVTVASGAVINLANGNSHTITVRATDPAGYFSEQQFTIDVKNVVPTITEGASVNVTIPEDGSPTQFDLTLNANDVAWDTLTWSILTPAVHGTASASGTGSPLAIGYIPNPNYNGPDSFVVQVSDGKGGIDTITVNVTITSVNDLPVITQGDVANVTMSEDGSPTAFSLPLDATDIESGTSLGWVINDLPSHGTAIVSGTGASVNIIYTPNPNYSGTDSFVVRVTDQNFGSDFITVNVTIDPINDAPVITQGPVASVTMSEDSSLTAFNLTLNATDIDSPTLTWSILTGAANGTASVTGTGASKVISYFPDANYNGPDSFVVQVWDGADGYDTITVNVTVQAVNDPPAIFQGGSTSITVNEDSGANLGVLLLTAFDIDDSSLSWSIDTPALHGTISIGESIGGFNASIGYTPNPNYNGPDSFILRVSDGNGGFDEITVNVTVTPDNDAPVITQGAVANITMDEDSDLTPFNLTLDATDADADTITWSILTVAANGTANVTGTGPQKSISYIPNANYNGTDSFVVKIDDGHGGFDTITVNVTIDPVNDAPKIFLDGPISVTVAENSVNPNLYFLTAFDVESLSLSWSIDTVAAHGTATVTSSIAGATISYKPNPNYSGPDSFIVLVSDGAGGTDTVTFNVTVTPINHAPEIITVTGSSASSVNITMSEDSNPTPFNLTLNASDPDGNTLTWSIDTVAAHGTASVSGTGTSKAISYIPNANYNGTDSFVVKIDDGNGGIDTITINVRIQAVNDAPTATNLAFVANSVTPLAGNLQGNDLEGGNLIYSVNVLPSQGTLSIDQATGAFLYTPYPNSSGMDAFSYKVFDPQGLVSEFATVTIDFRVTAVKTGNKLVILGTGGIDDLVISQGLNSIVVTGLNGTQINGNNTSVTFTGITQIEASLVNGNDSLWVQSGITLDNLTINSGEGNDLIILGNDYRVAGHNNITSQTFKDANYLRVQKSLVVNAGAGNDTVTERKLRVNVAKTIDLGTGNDKNDVYWSLADANTILGGTGDDSITLGYLSSYGTAFFDAGAGQDLLTSYGSRFYENASFIGGADSDTIALDVNAYDKNVTVDAGNGNNYVLFARSIAAALVDIKTGDGVDQLYIGRFISSVSPSGVASYTSGGSTIDRLNIDTGASVDTSQIFFNQVRQFFANYGAGRDEITIQDNIFFEDSLLDGGADLAKLTQRNNSAKLRFRNV